MGDPESTRPALVGNRMVLAGAVLYLLEWVAIIGAQVDAPLGGSATAADLRASYAHHVGALGWAAGWFSVVLLGRILLMVGLRAALDASGRPQRLMDLAVAAMAVSVTLEITVYAAASGGAWALAHGSGLSAVRTTDAVAFQVNQMIWAPVGVSLVCAGVAMWHSGLFARALPVLAVLSGGCAVVTGAVFAAPADHGVGDVVTSVAALLFWVWMIWAGIVVWRGSSSAAAPRRVQENSAVR